MAQDAYRQLKRDEIERLKDLVFEREYDDNHPDDYFNAGGFSGHWNSYTDKERAELMALASGGGR